MLYQSTILIDVSVYQKLSGLGKMAKSTNVCVHQGFEQYI